MNEYRAGLAEKTPPLAVAFFAAFARFEFALKRGGFLIGDEGKKAGPDWNGFAGALGSGFFDAMRQRAEASIFFDAPAKILTVKDKAAGTVAFEPPAKIVNAQMLFESLRTVRNNLFHGEKAFFNHRDEELVKASLFVLDSAFHAAHKAAPRVIEVYQYAPIEGQP